MKTAKVDAKTNRDRQSAFRRNMKAQGMVRISFYVTEEQYVSLLEFCGDKTMAFAILESINDASAFRRHVGLMEKISEFRYGVAGSIY